MAEITRQEMQTLLENMRTRMQDQLATRQDLQRACESSRDRVISYMHDYLQQNQAQFVRQLDDRSKMYKAKLASLEQSMKSLEQEVRSSQAVIEQMSQRQRNIVLPSFKERAAQAQYRYMEG